MRYSTLPPLNSVTARPTSVVTVPVLGLGIRPTRTQRPSEAADEGHHVGRGDRHVEVELACLHLGGEVVGADEVGAGVAGLLGGRPGGEDGDTHLLARARRQADGAAHHLVGLAGVDAEADGDVDGLVEGGRGHLLDDPQRLARRVELVTVERLEGVRVLLSRHLLSPSALSPPGEVVRVGADGVVGRQPTTSIPMLRAVPRTCCLAASRS